jgi:hypothetical protein
MLDGVRIALHAAKSHEDAAVEREPCGAVYGSQIADGGYPGGDNGVRECSVVRRLAAG